MYGARKRKYSPASQALAIARPINKGQYSYKKRRFTPGKDRTSGYYGRFAYSGKGGELKFHDIDVDDALVDAAGTVTSTINAIAQGVTESQRVGRKCTIKNIGWKWEWNLPERDAVATPQKPEIVRMILFLDKQANGATAAVTDILETADFQSFKNLANSQRFVTLVDRSITLNYQTLASDGAGVVSSCEQLVQGSFYKKCNIPLEFSSTTGAIGEIRSNNIGVLLISKNGQGVFQSKFRLRFSDN